MSENTFYITTPIYYVNDRPHIGHAYTTILADVLARYHRLLGTDTWFLTGTDEHGQKVQRAAEAAGMTPQQQADATVVRFQELWKKLEITHDDFIRTTEPRHQRVVQAILQDLFDRGEIYRDEYDGWYCTPCERFFMEKDIEAGNCPECGRAVEQITEANYFFRMSRYQSWLIQYIEEHPEFIQPDFRRNETLGFLRKPLNDLCISRPKTRMGWGIDLPFDRDFVCYVWFDALVNYISAVGYGADETMFNRWWPADYHLIGKDILTTHTVYWPTMLQAMGLPQPRTVFAHGWWLVGDTKMSKSLGNVVNPMEIIDRYGVDAFRYFLIAEMTLGQDAVFTEAAFIKRYNADLANDLGNMLSRVTRMINRDCGGVIPSVPAQPEDADMALWDEVQQAVAAMTAHVEGMRLDQGLARVMAAVRSTNRYLEQHQPWTLARKGEHHRLQAILYTAAESLRVTAGLLFPVMPERMRALRVALGLGETAPDVDHLRLWGLLTPGTPLPETVSLFPRIQVEKQAETAAPGQAQASGKVPAAEKMPATEKTPAAAPAMEEGLISIQDFGKVKLRTAVVVVAEAIPGADKLLRIEVLIGEERRQIVAGIARHYRPEDLVGRTVVVVANLQPARLRGVESNGMLLAATSGDTLRLIAVDGEIAPGAAVK